MKKYNYNYTIITPSGQTITDKDGIELKSSRMSIAKSILKSRYPKCVIVNIETDSVKQYSYYNNVLDQFR